MTTGCCLAEAQAPLQAFLRPAMWLPGVRRLHMAAEDWLIQGTMEQSFDGFITGVESIEEAEYLQIRKADRERHFVQLYSFTPGCNWLDVVEIQFRAGDQEGTTTAHIVSFSSGFIPACCPLAFLFNILLFWVPFSGNGFNTRRVEALRAAMQLEVSVTGETKCPCCPS